MKSFLGTVSAIVTSAVILWLGYHFVVEMPAAQRVDDARFRASMDAHKHTSELLDKYMHGTPEEAHEAAQQMRRERLSKEDEEARRRP